MLKKILFIVGIIFIVSGFLLVIYPRICNYSNDKKTSAQKMKLVEKIKTDEEYQEQAELLYEKLKEENIKLYTTKQNNLKDPFSYSDQSINLNDYGLSDNIIGFIGIPRLNIEYPIYLGASKENLNKGVTHLTETSYPIGGANTNAVLAAHRGHSSLKLFRDIDKLEKDDLIYIQNFREELTYKVFEITIIEPTEINKLLIRENEDMITLISCHPRYIDDKRYVVFAKRV